MQHGGFAVELKIIDPRIREWGLPTYQTTGAAAVDLYACIDAELALEPQAAAVLIPSGLALHMQDMQCAALVLPRSGLGHKKGLVMGNGVGLIDADYTGQVFISAWNRNPADNAPIVIQPGERIAQLMFVPILRPVLEVVEDFSQQTDRGAGGFGSTGSGGAA
ncbi:dUTP diphosphatase [Phaeobacter sp. B1627]|uniref:dUTP diphosphatase n=1 Tax=Phaeobacter sp. B1627 TaxID=2583809 RepID=UPI001118C297|nr:dUTP diphosphatase [Phaeobacter sp. B1627]TNJ44818.1 dUTP diphosphatase [Phaeobacter sp. B1627]